MPLLKLNTGKTTTGAGGNAPPTPASAGGGPKLKLTASQPPTPATEQPVSARQGKVGGPKGRKPAAAGNAKKRAANEDISPAPKRPTNGQARKFSLKLGPGSAPAGDEPNASPGLIKLGLKRRSTVPKLRALSAKRPPPPRVPGVGYDSEDSDAEEDPAIQQTFILRMQPGPDCELLHQAISEGRIGAPAPENPAEVSIRWLDKDFRRAVVKVQGRGYAAVLVDLPCIVETMKSWDRKGWWKVADLCQMMLVLGRCSTDEEAKSFPLPREIDKDTLQYPHGLTPPMHFVRKRRFRKRLSYKSIANVEEEVERLLAEDDQAEQHGGRVELEYLHGGEPERSANPDEDDDNEGSEAIETVERDEPEYEEYFEEDDVPDDADLEENLQAMFDAEMDSAPVPTAAELVTESPVALPDQAASFSAVENAMIEAETPMDTPTPAAEDDDTGAGEDSSSEDDDGDDSEDDEDSPDVMDEDAAAQAAERNQQLEEVADLEREVENQRTKVKNMTNQLLKQRATAQLATLEEDLRVKKAAFGMLDEDESEEEA